MENAEQLRIGTDTELKTIFPSPSGNALNL